MREFRAGCRAKVSFPDSGACLLAAGLSLCLTAGSSLPAFAQAPSVGPAAGKPAKPEAAEPAGFESVQNDSKSSKSQPAATTGSEAKGAKSKSDQALPTPEQANGEGTSSEGDESGVGEKHSVAFLNVVLEQEEQETFDAISRAKLDEFVKAVTSAADAFLNKQKAFDTKRLIVRCQIKKGGTQTFAMTSKPGLSGPITSGLDQALRKVAVPPVTGDLSMEIIYAVADEQTQLSYKARHFIREGKQAEAIEVLVPLATDDCKNAFVWQTLGWAYSAKGDFPNAEKTLKKAIELDPRDFDSWANLVSTYHSEGKVHEAEDAAKRNLDCAPNEESTDIVNINTALYTGEWATAETILRKLCKASGDYGTAYRVILAYALRWQGKNEEAKQLLESALKQHAEKTPKLDDYYEKLAEKQLALLNGDWKTAEELGLQDLSKDPKDYESLYDMGLALKGEGRLEEARKAFEAAVQKVTPKSVLQAVDVQIKELSATTNASSAKRVEQ